MDRESKDQLGTDKAGGLWGRENQRKVGCRGRSLKNLI